MEVACEDDGDEGAVPAVNKSVKDGSAGAVLEDKAGVVDGFVTFAVDDVTALLDREEGDGDGDEARPVKVRCARSRCRRLGFADFSLIFAHVW